MLEYRLDTRRLVVREACDPNHLCQFSFRGVTDLLPRAVGVFELAEGSAAIAVGGILRQNRQHQFVERITPRPPLPGAIEIVENVKGLREQIMHFCLP